MIGIFIADDHPPLREGIKRILERSPDLRVVGEVGSGDDLLPALETAEVDVLLLDISMPGPGFVALLGLLRERCPTLPVLVLSMHVEEEYALRSLRLGAAGFVSKSSSPDEIEAAIRTVARGGRHVAPAVAVRLAEAVGHGGRVTRHDALSEREFEVLRMVGAGARPGDVARRLELSPKTVSTYLRRIREKLGLRTRGEIVRYAVERDLVERGVE